MNIFPWKYTRRELPGPGSENIAYETLALPFFTPIGPGISNASQLYNNTGAGFISHVIGINGLGGLISGQMYSTSLADVPNIDGPIPIDVLFPR